MFSTWNGTKIRTRPMGAFVRREEGAIYFFTDARAHKDEEAAAFPKVSLGYADPRGQKYVSVAGTAELVLDRRKIKEPVKIWWGSRVRSQHTSHQGDAAWSRILGLAWQRGEHRQGGIRASDRR
jgi:general stress protein 26